MAVSMRDVAATIVVAGSAALAWAHWSGADWPLVDGPRTTAVLVYVLGVAACVGGSAELFENDPARKRWYHRTGSALSLVATGALVWALVTGSSTAVVILASVVVVKWALATARHLAQRSALVAHP